MNKRRLWFPALLLVLSFCGCITHLSVTKVLPGQNPRGLRVHLPVPFVVGRPTPDGTIQYSVELFPDPDQEYAIDAWSIMAKQKTDLARTIEMYIQKATVAQDTTQVAAQLASSVGAVGKSAVDQMLEVQKSHNTAVATQQSAVNAKRTILEKAQAEETAAENTLKEAVASKDETAVKLAQTNLSAKELAVTEAQIDFNEAQKALANIPGQNFEQIQGNQVKKETSKVPGPIIYKIVEDPQTGGIKLEPISFTLFSLNGKRLSPTGAQQLTFETWGKKAGGNGQQGGANPGSQTQPKLVGSPSLTIKKFAGADGLTTTIQFDSDVKVYLQGQTADDTKTLDVKKYLLKAEVNKASLKLTWSNDTPNGEYTVTLWVMFKDDRAFPFPLTVKVES
jgi:hypothetical protein